MATYRTTPTVAADIITYRFREKLVFVKPASNYKDAIVEARKVFSGLDGVPDEHISFYITATMAGTKTPVQVSESAWPAATARLLRGEVVDVRIELAPDSKHLDAPPRYLEVPDTKEVDGFYRESRSCPPSRSHSPSSRSLKSQKSWWQL